MSDEMHALPGTPAPRGNPGQCDFCKFETKELTHLCDRDAYQVNTGDSPEVWVCEVCGITVPRGWLIFHFDIDEVHVVAATNYGTNRTLEAIEAIKGDARWVTR